MFLFSRSKKCFSLGWPMNVKSDFFRHSDGVQSPNEVIIALLVFLPLVFLFLFSIHKGGEDVGGTSVLLCLDFLGSNLTMQTIYYCIFYGRNTAFLFLNFSEITLGSYEIRCVYMSMSPCFTHLIIFLFI